MRLVGVAGLGREAAQRRAGFALGEREEVLEALDAHERGGAVADGALEAPAQLALAQADDAAGLGQRRAVAQQGDRGAADERVAAAGRGQPLGDPARQRQQRGVDRRRGGDAVLEPTPLPPPQVRRGIPWSSSSIAGRPSAAPAEPMRKRTPQRPCPGVGDATLAAVAGPATITRPATKTMSAHASGSTRAARSCDVHTHATCASSPGGGGSSR